MSEGMARSPENLTRYAATDKSAGGKEPDLKPVSELTYREVFGRRNQLRGSLTGAGTTEKTRIEAEIKAVEERKHALEEQAEKEDVFTSVDQDLDLLYQMHSEGSLRAKDIDDAKKRAIEEDKAAGLPETDLFANARELRFREKSDPLIWDLREERGSGRGPVQRPPDDQSAVVEHLKAIRGHFEKSEPEIERFPPPENPEEAVAVVQNRLFALLQKAITQRKSTAKLEEFLSVEKYIEKIPDEPAFKGTREPTLSRYSFSRFSEGVFLKEKLLLFYEAMKNLTDRTVEVLDAVGGLLKLGIEESQIALSKDMVLPLTNINPVDWYVLAHLDGLFPEATKIPETHLDLQTAWDKWIGIGFSPYQRAENGRYELETILDDNLNLIDKKDRKVTKGGITLRSIYNFTLVEEAVRTAIAKKIDGGHTAGTRSELLAWCFLKVGLTFDMWDRERWKHTGKNEVRDLMWFVYKQIDKLTAERSGLGVIDTAGSYWAIEDQEKMSDNEDLIQRLGHSRVEEIIRILAENKKRATFIYGRDESMSPAKGTIIGSWWESTTCTYDGKKYRLMDLANISPDKGGGLKNIPFLSMTSEVEGEIYGGYFTYYMAMANLTAQMFMNTGGGEGWKVKDYVDAEFWRKKTDLLSRLPNYCPWLNIKVEKNVVNKKRELVQRSTYENLQLIAQTFARGIFWLGSSEAQVPKLLGNTEIELPQRGDYTFAQAQSILAAIREARFLDETHRDGLLDEIRKFDFLRRGAKK